MESVALTVPWLSRRRWELVGLANKLAELFRYAGDHDIPLYALIDEYDNFANTVLAPHGAPVPGRWDSSRRI